MNEVKTVRTGTKKHLPGEEGIWAVVFGDLVIFAILFGAFAYYRGLDVELFVSDQASLHRGLGLLNTIVLLTSSAFVAWAIQRLRANSADRAGPRRALAIGAALGAAFVVVKIVEWREKFAAGITIESGDFFMFYFVMGGIHLLHVLAGTGFLIYATVATGPEGEAPKMATLEGIGVFWHLVDMLWVFLFALLYLA